MYQQFETGAHCSSTRMSNETSMTEFIIMGFSNLQELRFLFFGVFLVTYTCTLLGNISIIALTCLEPHLHTPMYFFLGNLSFLDICYTTTNVPQMLLHLLAERKSITYIGCVIQLYFFLSFVGTECILLAVMAYDRYVAICSPLQYVVIMRKSRCLWLAGICWAAGFLNSAVHTFFTFRLPFCRANQLNYFFCDIPPLLKLACGDTSINEIILLAIGVFIGWTPFICIVLSYVYIISTILKIHSTERRLKAFSTCTSHLIIVLLYYGSSIFTYVRPISSYSLDKDRLISVLYSVVTPMLNPLIYSLRNKDVKGALRRLLMGKLYLQ
ncbi:olfactory receptor 5V1-like isoform X2 [Alligator mississippiensis]|uniref:olfactory receptor 5V1-like isoform X2 n=1 Tax=Alligator mississippiensis TaxID=8496 RepID=UPI0028776B1A|nr:olfactory receptor 5V1-like isoform X2 [Alligator mississippiensis]